MDNVSIELIKFEMWHCVSLWICLTNLKNNFILRVWWRFKTQPPDKIWLPDWFDFTIIINDLRLKVKSLTMHRYKHVFKKRKTLKIWDLANIVEEIMFWHHCILLYQLGCGVLSQNTRAVVPRPSALLPSVIECQ